MVAAYLLQNGWTDLAKLFLLAPSESGGGFWPKKFLIRDPVFPEKPDHLEGVEIEFWCINQLLLEIKNKGGSLLCKIYVG